MGCSCQKGKVGSAGSGLWNAISPGGEITTYATEIEAAAAAARTGGTYKAAA